MPSPSQSKSRSTLSLHVSVKPEQQACMKDYWLFQEECREAMRPELMALITEMPELVSLMKGMPQAQQVEQEKRSQVLQRQALVEGVWEPWVEDIRQQAAMYARAGITFTTWLQLTVLVRNVMRKRFRELAKTDAEHAYRCSDGLNHFTDISTSVLGEAYLQAKETVISEQQQAIREISTPVLQVRERLLILPVVGMVDTHRARGLTEALLNGIRERRARAVVMDITGVPIVDSRVANHLAQACEAARLMGATVILTGISPEIAQAMVTVGAELHGVNTVGDLQGGIEMAERILGYEVTQGTSLFASGVEQRP